MDATASTFGCLIRDLRMALELSQGQLADRLGELAGTPIEREYISRWERGKRTPSRFWLPHLAAALQVPVRSLEAERVLRRKFLSLIASAPVLAAPDTVVELVASIAAGDDGPLAGVQTAHHTDLAVSALASRDWASLLRLVRWMDDGGTDVLRVNAAGILAKTGEPERLNAVALALSRDGEIRELYVRALRSRVGRSVAALAAETLNPNDAGARWCSAWLLGRDGGEVAQGALVRALRQDPVCENVRTIGLMLNGVDPCM